jgi:RimJ/RimL family protein N-acetyltransferase
MSINEARLSGVWPLFGLELCTPRLTLRPVRDADLPAVVDAARAGIHDPAVMPFGVPWTDAPDEVMVRELVRHQWRTRAAISPRSWSVSFAVYLGERLVGVQDVLSRDLSRRRTIESASWLVQSMHGQGIGTEMRAAILLWAFDHLGAEVAESSAAAWNTASLRVSAKLGYELNGVTRQNPRRHEVFDEQRVRLLRDSFVRPDWTLNVQGVEESKPLLIE